MRLVNFTYLNQRPRAGIQIEGAVIDLSVASALVFENVDEPQWELIDILRGEPNGMGIDGAAEIAASVFDQLGITDLDELVGHRPLLAEMTSGPLSIGGVEMLLPMDEVRLIAPLPRPNTLRDFYAFEQHVETAARNRGRTVPPEWYELPAFYFSNPGAIYGPGSDVPIPRTEALDYELEIACVIGKAGRDILEEDAEFYIAGYMIMNDWSARDIQRIEMAVGLGPAKGKDFATSLGPTLVTPDELEERLLPDGRYNLGMVARVNGVERSRGNTRDMFYTFGQMIAHASRDCNLYPGDVLGSGTVGTGCLLELTHGEGPWLEIGDDVELEIGGLGVLKNRIV